MSLQRQQPRSDTCAIPCQQEAFDVTIRVPGSKSLTNRAIVMASLASGRSVIRGALRSDDTDGLLNALRVLGIESECQDEDLVISGCNGRPRCGGEVDLGHGGTPSRFMMAIAVLAPEPVRIDGSPRMRERPIAQLANLVEELGCHVHFENQHGHLPVVITPAPRQALKSRLSVGKVDSSQFISALLLIGPYLSEGLVLRYRQPLTSSPYIDMTLALLRDWGQAPVAIPSESQQSAAGVFFVPAAHIAGRAYAIEPDASSAIYFLSAAAITPGASCTVEGLGGTSLQPDMFLLEALEQMGAVVERKADAIRVQGPTSLQGIEFDAERCPDGAVMLAAVAAVAKTPTVINGLHTLKIKESDRIEAVATELNRLGANAQGGPDSLQIRPQEMPQTPVLVETYDDHRMAMAFAVLGLRRGGVSIKDPDCVSKSFPHFWSVFEELIQ